MSAKKKGNNSKKSKNQSSKSKNNVNSNTKNSQKNSTAKKEVKPVSQEKKNTNVNNSKNSSNLKSSNNKSSDNTKKTKEENVKVNNKEAEKKSKEEEIVFKNSKSKNKKVEPEKKEPEKVAQEKKEDKAKDKNTGKKIVIIILITVILVIALIFSICFAMVHATKDTIARGVSIKNIDVSNLTYNEAKTKLEEAFEVAIGVNINLKYEEYEYVISSTDINLSYELTEALEEAYGIGRNGNIIQNNYELISTAIFNKNIDIEFNYDEDALNTIVDYVSTNVPNLVVQYSYYIEDTNLIIIPGTDGIEVDKEALKDKINQVIQNRNLNELLNEAKDDEIEIPHNEVTADDIDIDKIYSEVKTEPQDAYYVEATETTDFEIHSDVDGIDFAITIDEAKAIVAEEAEQYTIPLTITKASITIDELGIEAFPYQVSKFETTYDASNTSRSTNLEIAASKIDGTVLMPGEQFSFNEVVGERTVSEGYQDAKIYSNGQVVDGLAGGICQISSTLYNAVLLANLQVDERYNHSFTTSYVKAGRDATVVYGVKDFKFTNTRSYPIRIEAKVANGVATFTIYGIEEENEYEVKIIPVTTSTTPYTTQTITDTSLTPGTTVVSQAGASGCTVTTYKEVYLNGVQISREVISNDTYQTLTRIVRVGASATTTTETETTDVATDTSAENVNANAEAVE